ncbi:hypothetical protein DTL72_18755 [Escherichia coli]|nr:hypothetical protein DTL38_18005 [Escherichia coli]RCY39955.1 hypothetical protein DTL77_16950 [Escherichia coli]RCY50267.1 hypothetical protein DTL72_18755 [Escherichia coli]RCY55562.1 hypothetical protein DTL40_19395 [Escherichia coli]RCY60055.1 hypothetical protein DTL74_19295 [Escherichia coli]
MSFENKCIMNILHICVTSKWLVMTPTY